MAAIANLSLNDGQATPVVHTFGHKTHSASSVEFIDTAAGLTQLARPVVKYTRLQSKDRNVHKIRVNTSVPVLETVSGNTAEGYVAEPKKVGSVEVVSDFMIHIRASEAAIKDARSFHVNACSIAVGMFSDLLLNDQMPY